MTVAIRWCEAEVADFELTNTLSNAAFLVAALAGLRQARVRKLPRPFVAAEVALAAVFAGSVAFHATRSWAGELMDEAPMVLLAVTYLWTVVDLVPRSGLVMAFGATFAATGLGYYVWRRNHEIFSLLFTLQVLAPALIAFASAPKLNCGRRTWYLFLGLILAGKIAWEAERALWRRGACPSSPNSPYYYLHALWHVLSASAHHAAMVFHGDLALARLRRRKKAEDEIVALSMKLERSGENVGAWKFVDGLARPAHRPRRMDSLTVPELRRRLATKGLATTGLKPELMRRLAPVLRATPNPPAADN